MRKTQTTAKLTLFRVFMGEEFHDCRTKSGVTGNPGGGKRKYLKKSALLSFQIFCGANIDRMFAHSILVAALAESLERSNTTADMPSTEVILTDNVPGLGAEADVVKVKRGYARNY